MTEATGPKISSWAMVMSGVTRSKMVGPMKWPPSQPGVTTSGLRPSSARSAPSSMPFWIKPSMRALAAAEMTGPTPTRSSSP